ncbi:MAG: sugar transferase [Fibrobacter sp.]|nr:sugar transferase [Fibrobacter sp.]
MYPRCLKRVLDFCCALAALCCLSPLLVALTLLGAVKMKGNPFFTQPYP